jgi:hypothetical protein
VLGILANEFIEPAAVLVAQVYLVVAAIDAEPAKPVLAIWNLFLVVVTGICDRYLLRHCGPPSPVANISDPRGLMRNDTQVKPLGVREEA